MTVFLVEQNAYQALQPRPPRLCDGERPDRACRGTGSELLANPEVRAAYLEGGARRRALTPILGTHLGGTIHRLTVIMMGFAAWS